MDYSDRCNNRQILSIRGVSIQRVVRGGAGTVVACQCRSSVGKTRLRSVTGVAGGRHGSAGPSWTRPGRAGPGRASDNYTVMAPWFGIEMMSPSGNAAADVDEMTVERRVEDRVDGHQWCAQSKTPAIVFWSTFLFLPQRSKKIGRVCNCLLRSPAKLWFATKNGDTREHSFKLRKRHCSVNSRSNFFTERIVNLWNTLPPIL